MRRPLFATILSAATIAGLAALPSAQAQAPASSPAGAPEQLSVVVHLDRVRVRGHQASATANAQATLVGGSHGSTSTHEQVRLAAATSGGCKVLHLYLQQLNLNLLGLIANLDKVQLDVTGHSTGGVLGQLFCRLSRGVTGKIARTATERRLNAILARRTLPVLRFRATVTPQAKSAQAPATGSCQVLDLVLGPLQLTLLGLEVDLNQVHLNVTANPTGGALGSLFCQLSQAKVTP